MNSADKNTKLACGDAAIWNLGTKISEAQNDSFEPLCCCWANARGAETLDELRDGNVDNLESVLAGASRGL